MPQQGKIIKSIAGFYEVWSEGTIYRCRAKGVFRALGQKPLVGDDVDIDITDTVSDPKEGNVVHLHPRRNELIRPCVANVDQALLLFAITNPAPSYNMLDRFLISMDRAGIPAILAFNKQDLATPEQIRELRGVYENCGCRVLFMTNQDPATLEPLIHILHGKTTVITGPSGAGKSTLINQLCPDARRETGELSQKIQRGRNTTRSVELLPLPDTSGLTVSDSSESDVDQNARAADLQESFLIDTPGFTSLYLLDVTAEDLKNYYPEFTPFQPQCRFQGCNHMAEPDCAVKKAVKEGRISRIRYTNYTEIYRELRNRKPQYR